MFKQLNLLKILLFLKIVTSTKYDYEITRGRKMWAGMYNAVHYFDHLTLLTDKMPNIQGIFTTYYPFNLGNDWSLNFELELKGSLKSNKDGFSLLITEDPPSPNDIREKLDQESNFLNVFPQKIGLNMFFTSENKLYATYKDTLTSQSNNLSCNLDLSRKIISFFIKGDAERIIISYHYDDSTDYEKCVEITKPGNSLKTAFPVFYARSSGESLFQINLNSMTLSTELENIGISEFEAKYDENIPKLFKKISFLKKNQEYLNAAKKKSNPENLNIQSIYETQNQIWDMVNFSNSQISHSLEETDVIISYIDQQKFSTDNFGHNVLDGIQSWFDNSKKEYEEMDSDISNIVTEIQKFNFDGLVQKTEVLLNQLESKLNDNQKEIEEFKKFSSLINKNLKILENKKNLSANFENNLKDFFIRNQSNSKNLNDVFIFLLSVMGVFIIFVLLMILWRLNRSIKKEIF